jgi:hypothetical protein
MKFLSSYAILSFLTTLINFDNMDNKLIAYGGLFILSMIIKLYENEKLFIGTICKVCSYIYYYFTRNNLVSCLIGECLELLFNKHTYKIVFIAFEKYRFHYQILFHNFIDIDTIFFNGILIYYLSQQIDYILIILLLLVMRTNYIYMYYLFFGSLSNYNHYHLISLGIIYFIGYNLYDYIIGNYKLDKVNIEMIKSYIKPSSETELDNSIKIIDNYLTQSK